MSILQRICALAGALDKNRPTTKMTRASFRAACKDRQWVGRGNKKFYNKHCKGCGFGVRVNENMPLGDPPGGIAFITLKSLEELKQRVNITAAVEKAVFYRQFQARFSGA